MLGSKQIANSIYVLYQNSGFVAKIWINKQNMFNSKKKMESSEIAIFSTIFGLFLALIDAYIERNIPG